MAPLFPWRALVAAIAPSHLHFCVPEARVVYVLDETSKHAFVLVERGQLAGQPSGVDAAGLLGVRGASMIVMEMGGGGGEE